ncbi:hypothetical protein [Natronoglycomyces albus]|uniref:DUF4190 domain-containing protein n=1 Tax=Natronoglycomyces albus TaxID=2811108 RepID=A0A895XKD0_9ACTN|nr:hypothetical protein [Natronoglycomyces albus]QSB06201.1 hypothetical protein JQS30_04630 [Natronoglycomyces albus]
MTYPPPPGGPPYPQGSDPYRPAGAYDPYTQQPSSGDPYLQGQYGQSQDGRYPGANPYQPQTYLTMGSIGARPQNGMCNAALTCGIIGVCLLFLSIPIPEFSIFALVLAVLATVFGGVGVSRVGRGEATAKGAATAGLVLGIVTLVLFVVIVMLAIWFFAAWMSM